MRAELRIEEDPAGACARLVADAAAAGGQIALSGGSTPWEAYERAAAIDGVDWSRATVWLGDERLVEPWDERSNYRQLTASLLDRVDPKPRAPRVLAELGLDGAADEYDRELREAFGGGPEGLDLAIMGLGPDTHTASLFPGRPALRERERLAVAEPEAGMEPHVPRVTMTLSVFNAAKEVVFLVTGGGKAGAVAAAFDGEPSEEHPSSLVQPESGRLVLLCDAAAASRLEEAA